MNPRAMRGQQWMKWGFVAVAILLFSKWLVMASGGATSKAIFLSLITQGLAGILLVPLPAFIVGWLTTTKASASESPESEQLMPVELPQVVTKLQPSVNPQPGVNKPNASENLNQSSVDEDAAYSIIATELASGKPDAGLWTRLFAEFDGDETKVKVAYIKQRAEKIMAAERARIAERSVVAEQVRREAFAKREAQLRKLQSTGSSSRFLNSVRQGILEEVAALLGKEPLLCAVVDSEGSTALHVAVRERNLAMSELLLRNGASCSVENNHGQTPRSLAEKYGDQDFFGLFDTNGLKSASSTLRS